jgi:hypothetical protein
MASWAYHRRPPRYRCTSSPSCIQALRADFPHGAAAIAHLAEMYPAYRSLVEGEVSDQAPRPPDALLDLLHRQNRTTHQPAASLFAIVRRTCCATRDRRRRTTLLC